MSRGTNTEGENYEALYQHAMLERNHMQAQLQDLLDKYTQLQKNSQVSVNAVLGQLEENRLEVCHSYFQRNCEYLIQILVYV